MKTQISATILMIVAAVTLAGCSTPASRIKANPDLFATFAPADQALVRKGEIALGFTPDMVRLALGKPDITTRRTNASGTTETWRWQSYDANAPVATFTYTYSSYGFSRPYYSYRGPYWGSGWGSGWIGDPYHWSPETALTDHLRVTFTDGRVTEIERLR